MPDFDKLIPSEIKNNFHLLSYRSRLPITIDYDTPETLGMDRVAAAVGARVLSSSKDPLLVVDAGSCITIDLLDQNDVYRGGAIAPGLRMRFRALHEFTAALPLVDSDEQYTSLAGRNTTTLFSQVYKKPLCLKFKVLRKDIEAAMPALKLFFNRCEMCRFFCKTIIFFEICKFKLIIYWFG